MAPADAAFGAGAADPNAMYEANGWSHTGAGPAPFVA